MNVEGLINELRSVRRSQSNLKYREALRLLIQGGEAVDNDGSVKKDINQQVVIIPGLERYSVGTPITFLKGNLDNIIENPSNCSIIGINNKGELEIKVG